MFSNVNKKLQHMLANMDPKVLEKGLQTVSELMNTEEGKKITEQIKHIDKEQLLKQLENIKEDAIVNQLDRIDLTSVADSLSDADKESLMKNLMQNPELLQKLRQLSDR